MTAATLAPEVPYLNNPGSTPGERDILRDTPAPEEPNVNNLLAEAIYNDKTVRICHNRALSGVVFAPFRSVFASFYSDLQQFDKN